IHAFNKPFTAGQVVIDPAQHLTTRHVRTNRNIPLVTRPAVESPPVTRTAPRTGQPGYTSAYDPVLQLRLSFYPGRPARLGFNFCSQGRPKNTKSKGTLEALEQGLSTLPLFNRCAKRSGRIQRQPGCCRRRSQPPPSSRVSFQTEATHSKSIRPVS